MMIRFGRRNFAALAAIGLAVAATAAFVLHGNGSSIRQSFTLTAQFEDSVGLYVGNSVSVLGMSVGKVTRIEPRGSHVDVRLEFDRHIDIPANAEAVTLSTSILTDRHIEITPPYRGGPKLKDGDLIGLGRTRTPVEFDKTLAMADKLATALRGDASGAGPVADLIAIASKLTAGGNANDIKATLDQLSKALQLGSDGGAHSKEQIQTLVRSLASLTHSASENDSQIRDFASSLRQLSDIMAEENLGAGTTGTRLNQSLSELTALLHNNRDRIKGTIANADTITKTVIDYQRELAEFFDVAPLALDNTYNAIDTNAGVFRLHLLGDKVLMNSQLGKELCNLLGAKQLSCATGTPRDYGPDFGLSSMLELMAGMSR